MAAIKVAYLEDTWKLIKKADNESIADRAPKTLGKAIIESQNFGLLAKVQKAIKLVPNSKITIEGHTDSFGSDDKNMELSQERANSVKQYLLANMNLSPQGVTAIGYGETKPIANNQTKEGRAKNRRIDLIIHTNSSM